jgi:hypothetical protein
MADKTYLSKEINFNESPIFWNGIQVYPGNPDGVPTAYFFGTVTILKNPEEPPDIIPNFYCEGNTYIKGNEDVGGSLIVGEVSVAVLAEYSEENGNSVFFEPIPRFELDTGDIYALGSVIADGEVYSGAGAHRLSAKKNFDIPHPTKEGWRLTHSCLEGPEAAVYVRGKLINTNIIKLPEYWEKLVDPDTITISVTPIGSYHNIFVKYFDSKEIVLESEENIPVYCFYHIFGERMDTEKLISEYEGDIEDYPGDNSERSIAGYHYDKKLT